MPTICHQPARSRRHLGDGLACVLIACLGWGTGIAPASNEPFDWAKERQFWAFQTPQPQPRPAVRQRDWPVQPLDFFVLARLEQAGLQPAPAADRRTLIRRLTLDLTGLPPSPEDAEAFVHDPRGDAYARLVDRLLAAPRFGERLASIWLPLARYAEDQAHQVGSDTKAFYPNAWRYREWVINAFNHDLPYDQFLRLQLAADKLAGTDRDDLAALGFLGLGHKYYSRGSLAVQADEWEDRVDTVTRAMLGLTVACARCHDHKFEPVTARDYHALAGVFASTRLVNLRPDGKPEDGKTEAAKMDPGTLHIVEDAEVKNLNVFIRGDVNQKGPEVPRGFLRVLSEGETATFSEGSGRRELAEAIASADNPLTARVLVNRVWGLLMGQPLVGTPSNFGHSGDTPTHPGLLDDLTARFVAGGWSVKDLVREIALSAAYRQASAVTGNQSSASSRKGADSGHADNTANQLLSRMHRKRLSIEQWRDSVLFVTGQLDQEGGQSLELDDPQNLRRTVYARISRLQLNDLLMQYDYPDANVHAEKRSATVTPTQKLFVLNSPFMLAQAKALATRLADAAPDDAGRVREAYRLLFARQPEREELKLALDFLARPTEAAMTRWEQYAQMLLASNEMLYVD
jgi:hypothetical protein